MITKKASQLLAGDVVRHTYAYTEDGVERVTYWVIMGDAYTDPDAIQGIVTTPVRGLLSTTVHTTEWTATEEVRVLEDDDRRRMGIPALRDTCPHPTEARKEGYIPGTVRGSVYIDGTNFTECGRCERRWFRTHKAA